MKALTRVKRPYSGFTTKLKQWERCSIPNIATIYDIGEADGRPYLVMEYIEGKPLSTIITKPPQIPLARTFEIIIQMCHALS
jgi:serine/threonine-protein kinase